MNVSSIKTPLQLFLTLFALEASGVLISADNSNLTSTSPPGATSTKTFGTLTSKISHDGQNKSGCVVVLEIANTGDEVLTVYAPDGGPPIKAITLTPKKGPQLKFPPKSEGEFEFRTGSGEMTWLKKGEKRRWDVELEKFFPSMKGSYALEVALNINQHSSSKPAKGAAQPMEKQLSLTVSAGAGRQKKPANRKAS